MTSHEKTGQGDDHSDLIARMRKHVHDRGGLSRDAETDDPVLPNGVWAMMLAAADAISSQSLSLSEAREEIEQLKADVEGLRQDRDQARRDYEQEADWSKTVDQRYLAGFDYLATQWLKADAVQRMHNAATSVFAKWSNDELMGRFKEHLTRIMHTAFVEGAVAGVSVANAKARLADAANDHASSDLSSLRKGAEVLRAAIKSVTDATCAYLPPDGISKDELISRVLAATDNPEINAVMLGGRNGAP